MEWKSSVLHNQDADSTTDTSQTTTSQTLRQQWYQTGHEYYQDETKCPATVDGVLGGFAHLSLKDLKASRKFLERLKSVRPEFRVECEEDGNEDTYALECGAGEFWTNVYIIAVHHVPCVMFYLSTNPTKSTLTTHHSGIGRVSKGLLFPLGITFCHLVEPSQRLLSHAPEYIGPPHNSHCRYYCSGLQDYTPQPDQYNIIFIQWVIGYLTDEDLVEFFKRCAVGLRRGGVIVLKDNTCTDVAFVVDREDASVTRSLPYILAMVRLAGLRVVLEEYQEDFPKNIFPVPMLALGRCDD
jgi:protein N-terminal methyltransferase